MPGWESQRALVREELHLASEDGRDLDALAPLQARFERAGNSPEELDALFQQARALPMRVGWAFNEPDELEAIRGLRDGQGKSFQVDLGEAIFDKMLGAWQGRCFGCALGKPVEGFMEAQGALRSWQRQKTYLTAVAPNEWPLKDYFPLHSPAESETGTSMCPLSTREQIAFMETDDDIRYTVLGQIVLDRYGRDFSTWHVGDTWMHFLPYKFVCTAETQAYRNLVERYDFHLGSGWGEREQPVDWNWVATHQNSYREWIGAQIRVDSYGYGAPGNPELAAEFAWRDARLSHVKNGIYGAMGCAAMIAAAFGTSDLDEIVTAGLSQIPRTSRLYAETREVIALCDRFNRDFNRFEDVISGIYDQLEHYHAVHTNNNYALCVAAVLMSGGDAEKGITFAVMGGFDSDCNGATVGSILGALNGAGKMPQHFVGRLNDTLNSQIPGYHPIPISQCARKSVEIARKVAG